MKTVAAPWENYAQPLRSASDMSTSIHRRDAFDESLQSPSMGRYPDGKNSRPSTKVAEGHGNQANKGLSDDCVRGGMRSDWITTLGFQSENLCVHVQAV
ncbi:hypothetical protein EVAR_39848_1 [Eumeta japonica]|uniref:Uncharacterized protein n=1 Tax=Eumeta variegata TaxID=151549 RepID=A0A4C1WUH9_EUMVA|nr:hypothetical protein EVAR_39848_1 [Eumeta japonica]